MFACPPKESISILVASLRPGYASCHGWIGLTLNITKSLCAMRQSFHDIKVWVIPAPSPITKPSLFLSQGRDALVGSSLRLDRALQAMKPPTPDGMMAASAPPASIRSASPLCMCSAALQGVQKSVRRWNLTVHAARSSPLAGQWLLMWLLANVRSFLCVCSAVQQHTQVYG